MAEKVLVYSLPTCPYCQQTKDYLKKNHIDFEDFNIRQNREKFEEMKNKSGQRGVPVIDIDGEIIKGFDKEKLDKLLEIS
ncbi:MAG: glutathione S-transferase N-terminal domain-containing protein [Candidatus Omnitrophica bacterium]|nr:glutathione S-transferase N-terminal domain-containing protein [Candidatus Omnitrophota bacterium]